MDALVSYGSTRGDTLIVFSSKYLICSHSHIIIENCKVLAPFLTEAKAAKLDSRQRIPGTPLRWRVDMTQVGDRYSFVPKRVNNVGLTEPIVSTNDDTINEALLCALVDLFGLWYHHPPKYGTSIREILKKSLRLIEAGNILGAMPTVQESVEKVLLHCTDPIWPYIAVNPAEWLMLGHSIQSRTIFKEALIHLVGKWKLIQPHQRARVGTNEETRNIVLVKLVGTWQLKKRQERFMLAFHPEVLKDVKKDARVMAGAAPGRIVYATHIFSWIALSLFRQWLAQMISEGVSFRAGDGGYLLYTAMSKGGNHYLKRNEMDNFYQIFPMTDKAKNIIDNAMNLIKDGMKEYVDPLIANRARFNDVSYLTSCEVDDNDYPWLQQVDEESKTLAQSFLDHFPEFGIWAPPVGDGRPMRISPKDFVRTYGTASAQRNTAATQHARQSPNVTIPTAPASSRGNVPLSSVNRNLASSNRSAGIVLSSRQSPGITSKSKDNTKEKRIVSETRVPDTEHRSMSHRTTLPAADFSTHRDSFNEMLRSSGISPEESDHHGSGRNTIRARISDVIGQPATAARKRRAGDMDMSEDRPHKRRAD